MPRTTGISWGHAVNSKKLLDEALTRPVDMIEADVMIGFKGSTGYGWLVDYFYYVLVPQLLPGLAGAAIPIMSHPPMRNSDLSLDEFLARVAKHNRAIKGRRKVGIKLDFKDALALSPALKKVAAGWPRKDSNSQLLWLNADVLPGPGAKQPSFDARAFLEKCLAAFPSATLSPGWTWVQIYTLFAPLRLISPHPTRR